MVLNIVTEQIKKTHFLSQVSRSYLSNLDGEPTEKRDPPKKWGIIQYMSAILDFEALHQFETHINGFLEPESPNCDPNHTFLSSLEAEIIIFLPKKVAILFFCLLRPSYKYFNVAPLPELIVKPWRPLIPKMVLLSTL